MKDNPEMTPAQIAFSIAKMKEYGIVDSGDTKTQGIGAMNMARVADFFQRMVKAGVVPAGLDYAAHVNVAFVNKKVGLDTPAH